MRRRKHSDKRRGKKHKKKTKKIKIDYKHPKKPLYAITKRDYSTHTKKFRQTKKKKYGLTIIPNTTPFQNKLLRQETGITVTNSLIAPASFSPQINKVIMSLRSISPNPNIFKCGQERKINITRNGRHICVDWRTKAAREAMLNNLLSKKKVKCGNIVAPKQSLSNCWFNAFFMVFFISDKGRKFHRFLREIMITGRLASGESIKPSLRWPFFLLNKYIDASLQGKTDPTRFAKLMDTNRIIREIYHKIHYNQAGIAKTRVPANPLSYYIAIMQYLGKGEAQFAVHWDNMYDKSHRTIVKDIKNRIDRGDVPSILFVEYPDTSTWRKKDTIRVHHKSHTYTYKLDSAVLRDTKQQHFSAYITCNKQDFGFDGESFSRITAFHWKKKLNKNTQWRFAEQYDTYFNFTKGYQLLIYYRI